MKGFAHKFLALKKIELSILQILFFNVFVLFLAGFIGRSLTLAYEHMLALTSVSGFVFICLIVVFVKRSFTFTVKRSQALRILFLSLSIGIALWFTQVVFNEFLASALDACTNTLCDKYGELLYREVGNGRFDVLLILMIVSHAIVTPIREEIMYRDIIFSRFNLRFSIVWSSVLLAVLFSVFHLKNVVFIFVFSLVLSALTLGFQSILPAIVVHGTYNTFVTIFSVYPVFSFTKNDLPVNLFTHGLSIGLMMLFITGSLLVIKRSDHNRNIVQA